MNYESLWLLFLLIQHAVCVCVCVFLHRMVLILFCQDDLWCTASLAWDETSCSSPGSASNTSYLRPSLNRERFQAPENWSSFNKTLSNLILVERSEGPLDFVSFINCKWMLRILVLETAGLLVKVVLKDVTEQMFFRKDVFESYFWNKKQLYGLQLRAKNIYKWASALQ